MTSSTTSTLSPGLRGPSMSLPVPWSFLSFRTMTNGTPVLRESATASGTEPSTTPAMRWNASPSISLAIRSAISPSVLGSVVALLMSM